MRLAALLLACAACVPDHGNNPVGGGPDPIGGGGAGGGDGGRPIDAGASGKITGKICVTSDVRQGSTCPNLLGSRLTVTLSQTGEVVTVASDGTFSLAGALLDAGQAATISTNLDDPTYYPSAVNVALSLAGAAAGVVIPVMSRDDVMLLVTSNGQAVSQDDGIVVADVKDGTGAELAGATLAPLGVVNPYYDQGDPDLFSALAPTGPRGTGIYFDATGSGTVSGTTSTKSGSFAAAVVPGTITWISLILR